MGYTITTTINDAILYPYENNYTIKFIDDKPSLRLFPDKIIFNTKKGDDENDYPTATIIFWSDGTKTVVKAIDSWTATKWGGFINCVAKKIIKYSEAKINYSTAGGTTWEKYVTHLVRKKLTKEEFANYRSFFNKNVPVNEQHREN